MSADTAQGEGIGAALPRKEDARLMRGRGCYVSDIAMHGLREVAFVRSPAAHAKIRAIHKPSASAATIFVREDLASVRSVQANLKLPGFKPSDYPPLAHGKVRFVGEAVAMCVASTRAKAEDLAESVVLDLEELPAIVDAVAAHWEESSPS